MKDASTPVTAALITAALTVGPDRHGRTVHIVDGRVAQDAASGAPVLACSDGDIGPGLVNAHTHLYSGLASLGMPKPQPAPQTFLQILERVWWRLDRALDPSSLHAAARLAVAQALLAGTTTLIDHHESPGMIEGSLDILAKSLGAFGARGLLCYGVTERNHGRTEALAGLGECARFIRAPHAATVRGLVGIHASFTV
ncbi:MAG: amidohydrolase family protein, partial [Oligoflexia bacterium]|nr:amidohydrolase family protein [Oligoflexia bacterium]